MRRPAFFLALAAVAAVMAIGARAGRVSAHASLAAAIAPATSVVVYRYDATTGHYASYSNATGGTDALTLNHLDATWVCVGTAATLTEPAA